MGDVKMGKKKQKEFKQSIFICDLCRKLANFCNECGEKLDFIFYCNKENKHLCRKCYAKSKGITKDFEKYCSKEYEEELLKKAVKNDEKKVKKLGIKNKKELIKKINKLLRNKELKKIAPEIKKYFLGKLEIDLDVYDLYLLLSSSKNYKVVEGELDKIVKGIGNIAKKAKGAIMIFEGKTISEIMELGEKIAEPMHDDTSIIWAATEKGKEKIKVAVVY